MTNDGFYTSNNEWVFTVRTAMAKESGTDCLSLSWVTGLRPGAMGFKVLATVTRIQDIKACSGVTVTYEGGLSCWIRPRKR